MKMLASYETVAKMAADAIAVIREKGATATRLMDFAQGGRLDQSDAKTYQWGQVKFMEGALALATMFATGAVPEWLQREANGQTATAMNVLRTENAELKAMNADILARLERLEAKRSK
jgi:hypothetical protein